MQVLVGSARINEIGDVVGGKPGDQTGQEVRIEPWYMHRSGWVVIRANDPNVREKLAQDMEWACENDNIGYGWENDSQDLYNLGKKCGFDARKIAVPCYTNCAKLVRFCILYSGIWVEDFYTGSEIDIIAKTGKFTVIRDPLVCDGTEYLMRGDILCTPVKGHTAIVMNDGELAKYKTYKATGNLYLRIGPGTSYPVVKDDDNGDVVITIGSYVNVHEVTTNGWAKCTYEGKDGYGSLKYLSPVGVFITTGNVHQRSAPGMLHSSLQVIPKDCIVIGTGRNSSVLGTTWYEVTYKGITGWCSGKYLKSVR